MKFLSILVISLAVQAGSPAVAAPGGGEISPRQIYQRVGPAVVLIMAVSQSGSGEMGTGSIIDEQGHIITNAHVILQASTRQPYEVIHVYLKPAKITGDPKVDLSNALSAKVVNWDRALDLALLQLEAKPGELKTVPLGESSAVEAGDPVVAIGHPEQGGLWTLTQGVVSTVIANLGDVQGKDVFQTDASINRGNSGGPLLNNQGAMIGVNTSMARKAKDGLTITSVNFSIKADVVKDWLAKNDPGVRYTVPAPQTETQPAPAVVPPVAEKAAEAKPAPEPTPEPPAIKPSIEPPAAKPATEPPAAKPSKAKILTPVKPFKAEDLIQKEISEMEDMGKEMQDEIEKHRGMMGQ
ncbi:MAG: serine protease [Elusimicrobia bacterium]|nr:serine protease [Elusimicrobiota bacterium]